MGDGLEPVIRRAERAHAADKEPSISRPPTRHSAMPVNQNKPVPDWEEPVDRVADPSREATFLSDLDHGSEHLPDWASAPIPDRIDRPFVTVQRIAEPGDARHGPRAEYGLRQSHRWYGRAG